MKFADLNQKKILIVGYGKEGKATETFLKEYVPTATIGIADISLGVHYLDNQQEYDVAIKSPGVLPSQLTIPYTTATNLFFELVKGMTIGVTGTKGKSTTTTLIYEILRHAGKKAHLVGNIGNPMLSELLLSNSPGDVWAVELSSFQLADIAYSPHISVLLSLFPEHMNHHGTVAAYYAAKAHIMDVVTEKDFVVYNADFPEIVNMVSKTQAAKIPFIPTLPFSQDVILLPGKHNVDNVRAAVTVAQLLDIPEKTIEKAVSSFEPLRHRLQMVGVFRDIRFYDDAISTTPQSTIKAIETLKNIGTIFLGGLDRGYNFTELAKVIVDYKIPTIVLFPQSGEVILTALKKVGAKLPEIFETDNNHDAIVFAYAHTKSGAICLMSPASPSYSLWKNFEERGDEFQKLVEEIGKEITEK